ncbi:penicillin acylase family protein [Pseudoduganella sp. RAF19]|uniref:penicillin acylase family protein n=1 Tax=Pseudoduganella sp. RAF19 TaxID=3233052 RepID=UPI003F9BF321
MNWKKRSKLCLAAMCIAALSGCGGKKAGEPDVTPMSKDEVEVTRTSFGVPHVKATTEAGLGYGLGYAYAQDNICLMADALVTMAGERSKYFGPNETYRLFGGVGNDAVVNITSDFYHKYLNEPESVKATLDSQPAELQSLLSGYARGYNQYLASVGSNRLPIACRDKPWVHPITAEDLIRLVRHYTVMMSGGDITLMQAFVDAAPPTGNAMVSFHSKKSPNVAWSGLAELSRSTVRRSDWPESNFGSNAVAVGKEATESGRGLLFANPHFPWGSIARFYQMHLTIPGKMDVMGASLGGLPVVNIGFNNNVAWSHTVNGAPRFVFYALALDPSDPTKYYMDNQSKSMVRKEISVETTVNGVSSMVKRVFYFSEHGPIVVNSDLGALWSRQNAVALADVNFNNTRMLQQWWEFARATSSSDIKASLEKTVGVPWVNTIATDRDGATFFGAVTPVPNVTDAKATACIPPPFVPMKAMGFWVLAGTTSACLLDDDPGAPQKGIFAGKNLPTLLRNDYVQNSNDGPWMTNPSQPLRSVAEIIAPNSGPQGARTRLGVTQIEDRLSGKDGLSGRKFTAENLQKIGLSNEPYFARLLLADLREACTAPSADIVKACTILAGWDGKANKESVGWPLFQQWLAVMQLSGLDYDKLKADPNDPIHTPSGLKVTDPAVRQAARQALATATQQLDKVGVDYSKPWGNLLQSDLGGKRIALHGGSGGMNWAVPGTLYVDQIYNINQSKLRSDGTLAPFWGASIVLTVSFEGDAPKAQGFLAFSQSTDPSSPHVSDQTERYSRKDWISYPFTDQQIKSDPAYATTKLKMQ